MRQFLNAPGQAPDIGCRNPFLQYRRCPLFDVAEGRIPLARFSPNKRQVGLQVIRFGTNL